MENIQKVASIGQSMKTAEDIFKQKEQAKVAYSLLGLEMPEKAVKTRKTSTGRKYKIGFRDLVENAKKLRIEDLMAYEEGEEGIDHESLCRTARAYIAYKIGHSLREWENPESGETNFYFKNRITDSDKSIEVKDMSAENAFEFVWAFYKDCLSDITDKYGIFQTETGEKVFLAVNGGRYHLVMIAVPETKTPKTETTETPAE